MTDTAPTWLGTPRATPFAPVGFAYGIDAALRDTDRDVRAYVAAQMPQQQAHTRVWSYLDDIVVLAPPQHMEEAVHITFGHLRPAG